MKKLLFILFLFISCQQQLVVTTSQKLIYETKFSIEQFDSVRTADTIPGLYRWYKLPIKNQNGNILYEYLYMKNNIIYRAYKDNDSINLTKRK